VQLFLEFEQAAFTGKELAPVERDDRAEPGVSLFAGSPELICETVNSIAFRTSASLGYAVHWKVIVRW